MVILIIMGSCFADDYKKKDDISSEAFGLFPGRFTITRYHTTCESEFTGPIITEMHQPAGGGITIYDVISPQAARSGFLGNTTSVRL
jgi:hypothetical protein